MAGNRYCAGALIRFAAVLAWVTALSISVQAQVFFDVATVRDSANVKPEFRAFSTNQAAVIVEIPSQGNGPAEQLELRGQGKTGPYDWQILALSNSSDEKRSFVLTIDHQKFPGSRLLYPANPGSIVKTISVLPGMVLKVLDRSGEDDYDFSLEPHGTATIAFQVTGDIPGATLWEHRAFDFYTNSITFFRGALLGIALLLLAGMLSLYSAKGKLPVLAGAALAFSSLGFIALEEGYLDLINNMLGNLALPAAQARAVVETALAASLSFCLVALLRLRHRSPTLWRSYLFALLAVVVLAIYGFFNPYIVAGCARLGFCVVSVTGLYLLARRYRSGETRTGLLQWSATFAWSVLAAIAALANSPPVYLSYVVLLGLVIMLVMLCYRLIQDRSEGRRATLHRLDADMRSLALAAAQHFVWEWWPHNRQLYVSAELEAALGYPPGFFQYSAAEMLLELMHPTDRAAYLAAIETIHRQDRSFINREMRLQRSDGRYRWFELRARLLTTADQHSLHAIGTLSDITFAKMAQERLLDNAVYDQVTGLPNRALFMDRLERELARHHIESLHVVLMDIDRFKSLNDGLGHEAGDAVLTIVGRRLEQLLGPDDTVARLPGDQFAILFNGDTAGAFSFARALLAQLSSPIVVNQQEVFLTACLGVASYRYLGITTAQIMKDAAIALYEAKRVGKGAVVEFQSSMQDTRGELVTLEAELRRAIERNEIEVHYQPIARLADMDLAGFEALVRWRHPVLGLLSPDSFLSLAEQTGMMKELGRFVLNEALRQLGIWQRAFRPGDPLFMAVNVSASQLLDTDIVADISSALIREAVYRQSVKIEITESIVMQFPEKTAAILERIKQHGVGLACDDFGTGYSSLSSLRNLPFDTLKIDRSFLLPDVAQDRASTILESIITLAHNLGMRVVVEGIENQMQVDRMGSLQVDFGQGYFIGQPMHAQQINEALLALPYMQAQGRTAISTLWDRANHDPNLRPADLPLTSMAISEAFETQIKRQQEIQALLAAEQQAMSFELTPASDTLPVAPRINPIETIEELLEEPIELPSIFAASDVADAVPPNPATVTDEVVPVTGEVVRDNPVSDSEGDARKAADSETTIVVVANQEPDTTQKITDTMPDSGETLPGQPDEPPQPPIAQPPKGKPTRSKKRKVR